MKILKILIIVLVMFLAIKFMGNGCGCSDNPSGKPSKKDIEADLIVLKRSCRAGYDKCKSSCNRGNDIDDCTDGCNSGFRDCIVHLESDQPNDWQPADAFYDGCINDGDVNELACADGQLAATCNSQITLQKYGTTSLCIWIPNTPYDSSELGELRAYETYLGQLKKIQRNPLSNGLKLSLSDKLYCSFFTESFFNQPRFQNLRDLIQEANTTSFRFWGDYFSFVSIDSFCNGDFANAYTLKNAIKNIEEQIGWSKWTESYVHPKQIKDVSP